MNILVVQESDWVDRGPHQSHHLLERLSERGHEIRVIDYDIDWKKKKDGNIISERKTYTNQRKATEKGNITVIRPSIVRITPINYIFLLHTHRQEIKKQIKEFKPDVIVGFGILNANIAIRLAKKEGIQFVYYIIDELHRLIPQKPLQAIGRKIESWNMKNADRIISINEGLREYTISMGADPKKTEMIRAGVDLEKFKPTRRKEIREKYGIKEEDTVLFFMGFLYPFSGLKEVSSAVVKSDDPHIKLLIIGKGDLWDELQEIKKKDTMGRIITEKWVPYEDVPAYVTAADICILPAYKNEIMKNIVPIKMYEYMAAEKPIIATRLPGLLKEFKEGNGITYIERSEEALVKAKQMIKDGTMKQEGLKARKFVENNDWEKITNFFETSLIRGK